MGGAGLAEAGLGEGGLGEGGLGEGGLGEAGLASTGQPASARAESAAALFGCYGSDGSGASLEAPSALAQPGGAYGSLGHSTPYPFLSSAPEGWRLGTDVASEAEGGQRGGQTAVEYPAAAWP